MNQIVEQKVPVGSVSIASGSGGSKIAPQNLGEVVKFAEVMSRADIALPKHLRGNPGACMAVAMQALEWEMSPFAVASKSYAVNGAIAYEAQLIAAVVNTRSGIKGRLKYTYEGEGASLQCTVTGILDGEEYSYTSPRFDQITTKNSPLWKTDPQQQLGYYSARSWARRYTPEVILGVYDREEAQEFQGPDHAKDVTPSIVGRLKAAQESAEQPTCEREGFSDGFAHAETETLSGDDYEADPDTGEITDTNGEATGSLSVTDAEPDAPSSSQAGASAGEGLTPPESSPAPFLVRFAKDVFAHAINQDMTGAAFGAVMKRWHSETEKLDPADQEKAKQIGASAKRLFSDVALYDGIIEFYSEMLGCEPTDLMERTDA